MRRLLLAAGALVALAWPLSGVFLVDHGDNAVIFRLGRVKRIDGPGAHLRLPWPLERHEVVSVSEVRRVASGKRRLLTGDTNLVDIDLVVQYTVSDPVAFATATRDPEAALASVVASVATDAVRAMDVDTLLTTGRTALQLRVLRDAQAVMDDIGAGISVAAVEVRELSPPPAVVDAFNDVSSARGDRETLALGADGYAGKLLPQVRGEAAARREDALARASERVARASGDADRFAALAGAGAAPAVRARMTNEAVERVGARAELRVVPPGSTLWLESRDAPADKEKRP